MATRTGSESDAERTIVLADNRKARFDYHIEDSLEAGIALQGTEIKSLRAGHANLRDGYARVEKGEVWLRNVHIAPWANAAHDNHDPLRPRKLLLHREQIGQLAGAVSQKGYTLVPLGRERGPRRGDLRRIEDRLDVAARADRALRLRRQAHRGDGRADLVRQLVREDGAEDRDPHGPTDVPPELHLAR